jgi:methylmalonyl-CoA mutase C-terminal domain/subunit
VALVKKKTDKTILVIGGGIIPQKDIPRLKEGGVAMVFGPGTPISKITDFIHAALKEDK